MAGDYGPEPAQAEVEALGGPVLLEFGNAWCGYCRRAQPLVAAALARHPRVRHIKVADGGGRPLGRAFRVKLWPTLVFLRDGREVARLVRPADANPVRAALEQIDVDSGAMARDRTGFSLIEMAIAIGVVATLALMTLPTFLEKNVRDQVAEALPLADIAKPPIAVAWAATQKVPQDNEAAGLPVPEKIVSNYVSSVTVQDGAIHVKFGNRAHGSLKDKVVTLRPAVVQDSPVVPISWVCGNAGAPDKMTVKGINRTDVPPTLLPLRCRP
jgi:type IV pilus assembly protein PilA